MKPRVLTIAVANSVRPYIFVTNGGGKTEEERCLDLSRQLELEISPGQFICGHSPMREMAEIYGTVLVVGGEGEKCRQVAEGYGFKDVVTPGDIIKDNIHVRSPILLFAYVLTIVEDIAVQKTYAG